MRVLLGDNLIEDCDAALVVGGVEVFRLRERHKDGRLIVDFDVRGPNDERIAKIAKNNVVHGAPGYDVSHEPRMSAVKRAGTGEVVARVEEIDSHTVRITGEFWVGKYRVSITPEALVAGGITLSGNTIQGFKKAIRLDPGSFAIGCS